MKYRNVATQIWSDDTILRMSPEQKLIFLYLHTSPYTSACGIFRLQLMTMSFQVGFAQESFESGLKGCAMSFPEFICVDWDTMEVALLQYPKQLLIAANNRTMAMVAKDIQEVKSQLLLRAMIAQNSATLSAPYLNHLRRLQTIALNEKRAQKSANTVFDGDVVIDVDNQQTKLETETETKINTLASVNAHTHVRAYEEIQDSFDSYEAAKQAEYDQADFDQKISWMEVANSMLEFIQSEGFRQWEFMCDAQGIDPKNKEIAKSIFSNWAGKASPHQLKNWKREFPKLQTWLVNEKRKMRQDIERKNFAGQTETPKFSTLSIRGYIPKT